MRTLQSSGRNATQLYS